MFLNDFVLASGLKSPPKIYATPFQMPQSTIDQNMEKLYAPTMEPDIKMENIVPARKPISPEEIKKQANTIPPPSIDSALKAATSAEVQAYRKISLPEAIAYAQSHNLDIMIERLNVDLAKNDIKTANRLRNPRIETYLNTGKAADDNPNMFGLIFPFEIAKRSPRKNVAKSVLRLTQGEVLLEELFLRLEVRRVYLDVVSAKSKLKILEDQRKLLQDLLIITQKKYKAGACPAIDIIHSKMTLNETLIQVNSAKADVLTARYRFNLLLESENFDTKEDYLPDEKEFVSLLTPDPLGKMPDFETIAKIAMEKRLDIRNARQEIDIANKKLTAVIRQRVPDVEIGGGYMFVPSQKSTTGQNSSGVYAIANITNIPLLYMYNPEVKNARIEITQKEIAYNNIQHHALMNLHSAYAEFLTAQANLNYYDDVLLTESNQFLFMARKSYELGKTNITNYIFIEQQYKNIMLAYIKALTDYYKAWTRVLREVNDEELKLDG